MGPLDRQVAALAATCLATSNLSSEEKAALSRATVELGRRVRIAAAHGDTGDHFHTMTVLRVADDYSVLLALSEAPERRMRSSELAAQVGWERSRLSHHLGRMERRDLVRREECATDSRGAEIVLTAGGASAFRGATVPHLRAVRELFIDPLTSDQLTCAGQLAAALRAHLRPHRND